MTPPVSPDVRARPGGRAVPAGEPVRIPLTVIGGFLGAGKTTLLNRVLADAGGRRLAVLVNDFGAVNIDAALVASTAGDTVALTNGCVCCSIGDDLSRALIGVLDASPRFDGVVIEASGVSDPWRIAQLGLADPGLSLDGVIVLLDAAAAPEQARDPLLADSLERQLRAADLVVINKTDLVDAGSLARVRAWVEEVAGATPMIETAHAAVPPALLWGLSLDGAQAGGGGGLGAHAGHAAARGRDSADGNGAEHDHDSAPGHDSEHGQDGAHDHDGGHGQDGAHGHDSADGHDSNHDRGSAHDHGGAHDHGEMFDTWLHRPQRPLQAAALRAALRGMPPGVLRLKGLVVTDEHGWAELQFAGKHGSLRKAVSPPPADAGGVVVAIALRGRLPAAALDALFGAA